MNTSIDQMHYLVLQIGEAQLKLLTETTPIKEIAYQLGFEGQAYFNRVVKQVAGVSPATDRELGLMGDGA